MQSLLNWKPWSHCELMATFRALTWWAKFLAELNRTLPAWVGLLGSQVGSLGPWTSQKDQGQGQAGKQQHQAYGQNGVKREGGVFRARYHSGIWNRRKQWSCRNGEKKDANPFSNDSYKMQTIVVKKKKCESFPFKKGRPG